MKKRKEKKKEHKHATMLLPKGTSKFQTIIRIGVMDG
jgi:hypothetical protein